MKLGIVIHSNDAETVWNAFRLGIFALHEGDSVKVFLLAKGVERNLSIEMRQIVYLIKQHILMLDRPF
ncbi:MAG: hypothetical protein Q8N03_02960 [Ignavibacteria bacterium]|nr:hypothetical protein [Ignavibacteria bacterium]